MRRRNRQPEANTGARAVTGVHGCITGRTHLYRGIDRFQSENATDNQSSVWPTCPQQVLDVNVHRWRTERGRHQRLPSALVGELGWWQT